MKEDTNGNPLHIKSLNHISLLCRSVEESISFYHNVLGFLPIRRPGSFDFDGAWLFGHGIGIHLLQSPEPEKLLKKTEINPKDNHISFQVRVPSSSSFFFFFLLFISTTYHFTYLLTNPFL
ncbi:Glyoxalase/Bleomycin resistance protein/Dihydroxybiphenyl dioxygenase [Arabidopsis thaliana x Arabidopsis arenosa]|uniref:Glyoxalase/Bleomycin resistance protein/Dihydroxybiphenyl dioxygenase n=1 Tax=Arabidopsis thaliana x Arabidopsis arenosa TaxID=1240361 RepID=A0A8T2H0G0_9BRAS|nr:Glyoxalase/Bleomycin resistance protein/Dihydroxybiphenyl dioxygenase [Arabidopsis thaliana x Arabidopsis arenosa]